MDMYGFCIYVNYYKIQITRKLMDDIFIMF